MLVMLAKFLDALGDAAAVIQGAGGDAAEVGLHRIERVPVQLDHRLLGGLLGGLDVGLGAELGVELGVASDGHGARRRDLMSAYADQGLDTRKMRVCAQVAVLLCEAALGAQAL